MPNGMLNNIQSVLISGGAFTNITYNEEHTKAFDSLRRFAASAAIHNSGESFTRPRCHKGTRVAVLKRMKEWIHGASEGESDADKLIMWLYGDAGAGKSAIAQTLAEQCHRERILLAGFFFSRSDTLRNTHLPLVATLAYQAALALPGLKDLIIGAVARDPMIFEMDLSVQLEALLISPLNTLSISPGFTPSTTPYIIIIDGLDECSDFRIQCRILEVVSDAIHRCRLPLKVLFASRPEMEIRAAFCYTLLEERSTRVALDAFFKPDDDIWLFFEHTFRDIKTKHRSRALIPPSWPSEEARNALVQKASGQFIYASTVANYISSPHHHPVERLDVIQRLQLRNADKDMPFADLDSLYFHVFSIIPSHKFKVVMRIVGLLVLRTCPPSWTKSFNDGRFLRSFLFMKSGELEFYLDDLASIITCSTEDDGEIGRICVTHASLFDFLLDQRRAKHLHINQEEFFTEIILFALRHLNMASTDISGSEEQPLSYSFDNFFYLADKAGWSKELEDALQSFRLLPTFIWCKKCIHGRDSTTSSMDFAEFAMRFRTFLAKGPATQPFSLLASCTRKFDECLLSWLELSKTYPQASLLTTFIDLDLVVDLGFLNPEIAITLFCPMVAPADEDLRRFAHDCLAHAPREHKYMLWDFLTDRNRSGEHILDGSRYAEAASVCLREMNERITHASAGIFKLKKQAHLDSVVAALKLLPHLLIRSDKSKALMTLIRGYHLEKRSAASSASVLLLPDGQKLSLEEVQQALLVYMKRVDHLLGQRMRSFIQRLQGP